MIILNNWKTYKNYNFEKDIQPLYDNETHSYAELGEGIVGKDFIWVADEYDKTLSFVYDGWTSKGAIYKLIWKG